MKYQKPEAHVVGSANALIQGMDKTSSRKENGQDLPSNAAYEADE